MNLGQASKHLEYMNEEAKKFVEALNSLKEINAHETLKEIFFDLIFKIIFGINSYS